MLGPWLQDLESLEAISQNDDARKIFLRMAAMSHDGRLPNFLAEVAHDDELDDDDEGPPRPSSPDDARSCSRSRNISAGPSASTSSRYTGAPVAGD